jgi:hydrogenase nickel incorporation protein HypA/HybF
MHEHHQVKHLVDQILAQHPGKKITGVEVIMGDALGFDEGSVRLYFETFGEGNALEGAEITFTHIPAELNCKTCNKNFVKVKSNLNCPTCGQQGLPTDKGKEFTFGHLGFAR